VVVNNLGICGAAYPHLPARDDGTRVGRVIQIASDSAIDGVSKTALLALSRGFAKDAAGTGVTVNSVIAGLTHTAAASAAHRAGRNRQHGRLSRPAAASATTGGALRGDGGYVDSIVP
jgi:NAD(P)-dependent dehydrogenase (short-subunit alcohol dehydrogenase family)